MLRILGSLVFLFSFIAALYPDTEQQEPSLRYYLPEGIDYDESVPTPGGFFGFEPGEWHLRNDQITGYLREIADRSDRMKLLEYGRTHEQKPLYLLHVSSPKNLDRLDEIQAARIKIREGEKRSKNDPDPFILWLGYSVHGNEPSGANSVPLLA